MQRGGDDGGGGGNGGEGGGEGVGEGGGDGDMSPQRPPMSPRFEYLTVANSKEMSTYSSVGRKQPWQIGSVSLLLESICVHADKASWTEKVTTSATMACRRRPIVLRERRVPGLAFPFLVMSLPTICVSSKNSRFAAATTSLHSQPGTHPSAADATCCTVQRPQPAHVTRT